jgi:gliding motility-associated-like protein
MSKSLLRPFFFFFFFFVATHAFSTHNRAGEIIYRHLGGINPTYEITIITYTESLSLADRDSLNLKIYFCNNTISPIANFVIRRTLKQPIGFVAGVQRNEYKLAAFTFPGPGCYRLTMLDPNRIDNIINISGSVNVPFYIEDTLLVRDPQFFGQNSSPVLLEHPIVYAPKYSIFQYNPAAFDPDGDSLTFVLLPPKADPGNDVPGYKYPYDPDFKEPGYPNDFTLDFNTGDIVWDVPTVNGIYNIAFLVTEYRDGVKMGTLIRDMQIIVTDSLGNPPEIVEFDDTCVVAGTFLRQVVTGTDPDAGQTLKLTANGGPFHVGSNPAVFNTSPSNSPVNGLFRWQTDCSHIRPGVFTVVFKVTDNTGNGKSPFSDTKTWQIKVVAPPPENLVSVINGNQVELSWDNPYSCANAENFIGFTVWRKRGCDSLVLDSCMDGGLGPLGYSKINGPDKSYTYIDNNLSSGIVYSYRVQAEFAKTAPGSNIPYNQVSSIPSNEVCAEIKSDVPILTHADVTITDQFAGQMVIRWVNPEPDVLDTILNKGPYRIELYEGPGFSGNTNKVFEYTVNQFSQLNIFSYTSDNLNTESNPYHYSLKFYATNNNGTFYEVGESAAASSVYLSIAPSTNQLTLSWNESVPWVNYEYYVLRERAGAPGQYDTIAKTPKKTYIDTGLTIGETYCYKIRAYGSYYNSIVPSPQINHSQQKCDIPRDITPPCSPELEVTNICDESFVNISPEDLANTLRWTNPINQCGDEDVIGYRIYYAPSVNDSLELLATVNSPDDTVYVHKDLTSLAGCYAVTAIDSFLNESVITKKVCVDNCPLYNLPNVFTPNNDGKNDLFTPFLPFYFVDHIELQIFNRWGNLVYETTDPVINWDGTDFRTGKDLAEGVYHYICYIYEVRITGVAKVETPLKGFIEIIRTKKN